MDHTDHFSLTISVKILTGVTSVFQILFFPKHLNLFLKKVQNVQVFFSALTEDFSAPVIQLYYHMKITTSP